MPKKYNAPPVVEAVCEFRFTGDTPWDLTIPGILYENVKIDFPRKDQIQFQGVQFIPKESGLEQEISKMDFARFLNQQGNMFIQIGQRVLTLHCMVPYPTWHEFQPKIQYVYNTIAKIIENPKLARVGLRYINRIIIPDANIKLEDYFEYRPQFGSFSKESLNLVNFIVGSQILVPGTHDLCRIQLTNNQPEEGIPFSFLLDLDYATNIDENNKVTEVIEWVDKAHNELETYFEGCITNKLRALFQEIKG